MNAVLFATFHSLALASSQYRLNGNIDPYTLTPTYWLSYHVDDEFIYGAKGQEYFSCCSEHDKHTIREAMARSTILCQNDSNWAPMAAGGAAVVLQEITNGTGCVPMPCTNSYGTLNCDASDVSGCFKMRSKMQQTVDTAKIVDVSSDDSGFHPQFKVRGLLTFSFNFNGKDLLEAPCIDERDPFTSAQAGIDALKKAAKATNISQVPVFRPGVPFPRLKYFRVFADGLCVGDILHSGGYDVMKILLRYAETAPVVHSGETSQIVV